MRARGFGAGLGLPNIKNSVDEFNLESRPGAGTTLTYVVRLT
jgi:anti-sigma regulatory factor (Ser/Thr protein kinase)